MKGKALISGPNLTERNQNVFTFYREPNDRVNSRLLRHDADRVVRVARFPPPLPRNVAIFNVRVGQPRLD